MSEYHGALRKLAANDRRVSKQSPEVFKAFVETHDRAIEDKALSYKHKELIALGIAICVRCEGCIISHVRSALKHGATMEELSETVEVAIMMGGGPSLVYGGKALECAEEFMPEFTKE